ncbi:hypothetical protein SAMN04487917_101303 [Arthrobacter sp. yr096]|uniref:peptidoglycan-binding protein n=1 Tax=Arthrobacter sp. yr096 TaxID=1761750 RepID=UPI0008C854A2|nr:peptidoglycan-binding protein [Arthrobacter sp. yr096]SEI44032.1 hypothetical protein SAMN04487917_101303 [Arthrobacter sp. yr096]
MTLHGDPQLPLPPATEAPFRFRRGAPGATLKSLVAAGTMLVAIAMTPPLPDFGPPQPAGSSIALDSVSFQRLATPAIAGPPHDPAAPAPAEPPAEPAPAEPPVAAPEEAPEEAAAPAPAEPPAEAPGTPSAVVIPPTEAAPQPPATEPQPAQPGWTIYVAGSGGQDLVDACIGPIHFTPTDSYSLFITEHDFCGGWARFSGIGVGQPVTLAGYGSYIVTARGQVPLGGTTSDVLAVFGGFPRAVLQTCIPGTSQMLVIALN